jgi:hypothetical protein
MTVIEKNGNLELILNTGSKTRRESVRGIKPTATDQDLYDIASAIANLLNDPLVEIRRVDTKSYSE